MWSVLRILATWSAAGMLLALCFLTPGGALVGAVNGLLLGTCVTLAERRARQSGRAVASAVPIRLIGSHAGTIR